MMGEGKKKVRENSNQDTSCYGTGDSGFQVQKAHGVPTAVHWHFRPTAPDVRRKAAQATGTSRRYREGLKDSLPVYGEGVGGTLSGTSFEAQSICYSTLKGGVVSWQQDGEDWTWGQGSLCQGDRNPNSLPP